MTDSPSWVLTDKGEDYVRQLDEQAIRAGAPGIGDRYADEDGYEAMQLLRDVARTRRART